MRLTLDPIPLDLHADAVTGEVPARRRIAGLAVPWEIEAPIAGKRVTFAAGSIAADASSPLLLGHDPQRPVGVLMSAQSVPAGMRGTYAIDATPDGDIALAQAASGSRRGLSVGVDADEVETDPTDPDRIRVTAGRLAETSLVSMPGYSTAQVDQIAAQRSEGVPQMSDPPTPTPDPQPQPPPQPEPDPAVPARAVVIAERDQPDMRLGEYVQTLVRAEKGDREAAVRIEAALDRANLAGNPGVIPIAYVREIVDGMGDARPLFDAVSHAELPAAGMQIRRPIVTSPPEGAWVSDTDPAPTNPVTIGNLDETIALTHSELVHFVRPSADLLFESVAGSYGSRAIAVVLTGTGSDGAAGVRAIKERGGIVIVQDEQTSQFFGMPAAAIETGCADFVLPLEEIAPRLVDLTRERIETDV